MSQTETPFEMDTETFIDEDGEYGEPGQEYVFHPESTPNGEPKQKQPDTILRTPTQDEDDVDTEGSDQSLQDEMQSLIGGKECKEEEEGEENQEQGSGGDTDSMTEDDSGSEEGVMFGDDSDTEQESGTESEDSEFLMKDGEVV